MAKIVIVGSSNIDMVVKVPHLPSPGETVMGSEFVTALGGKGANQAVAAARLGADVTLVARVGHDIFGEQAIAGFQQEGLNIQHVSVDQDAASGVALIAVDARGENSIAVAAGANRNLSPDAVRGARADIQEANVLLLQLELPLEITVAAAEMAHAAGARVILNPAPALGHPLPAELLAKVDILTPNEIEVRALVNEKKSMEEAARQMLKRGVGVVIVTLGAQGALLVTNTDEQLIPGFLVEAVDTTAAGDAFNGGLAVGLARGQPLAPAVRFACACGALAATRLGAQPSLPTEDEVDAFG